jgi:hypothetical protein
MIGPLYESRRDSLTNRACGGRSYCQGTLRVDA